MRTAFALLNMTTSISMFKKLISNKKTRNLIFVVAGIIVLFVIFFFIYQKYSLQQIAELESKIALQAEQEQCSRPVASGERIYTITTDNIPKATEIIVNPLDVEIGETQTVTVKANDSNENPITLVSGSGGTDNDSIAFSLTLIDGDAINGTWQGSWSPQHTFCNNFTVGISVTSDSGESDVVLTFR